MAKRPYREKTWLQSRWSDPDYTVADIIEEAGCTRPTIDRWRVKHDLSTKQLAEGHPYTDEGWLRERWWSPMSGEEIAEEAGCDVKTIYRWGEKHGFPPRSEVAKQPWHDPDTLRKLYHEDKLTQQEIAEKFGIARGSIQMQMEKHGIERRSMSQSRMLEWGYGRGFRQADIDGYEIISHDYKNESHRVCIHRLAAVAWFGFDEVANNHVHHGVGPEGSTTPWDNREENIAPLTPEEHKKHHASERVRDTEGKFT